MFCFYKICRKFEVHIVHLVRKNKNQNAINKRNCKCFFFNGEGGKEIGHGSGKDHDALSFYHSILHHHASGDHPFDGLICGLNLIIVSEIKGGWPQSIR